MIIYVGSAALCFCFFPFWPCIQLFQFNYPTVKNTDKANKLPPHVTDGKWGMWAIGSGRMDGGDQSPEA